jgi:hypothetical protein
MTFVNRVIGVGLCMATAALAGAAWARGGLEGVPRFDHVVVIVEENKDYDQIVAGVDAPNLARLARLYGDATRFFGEVHPSEANYVALLGGDTFGIHDDDAYFCRAGMTDPACGGAAGDTAYPDHTISARHLGDQLKAAGLSWKGYYESLPAPGSLAVVAGDPKAGLSGSTAALYASKHSGFLNFASVQQGPDRARRIVGFNQLDVDIAGDDLPNFALIVFNQCDEMHGLKTAGIPEDCEASNVGPLISRGDALAGRLVERLQATRAWRSRRNMAIVITFDEGLPGDRSGCCGATPDAASNFGGGHIPTIVMTNHGPRALADDTPYNHYSLLRTIEDAFGLGEHLGRAAQTDKGVRPMIQLFGGDPHAGRAP